jgi:hypothetical protein
LFSCLVQRSVPVSALFLVVDKSFIHHHHRETTQNWLCSASVFSISWVVVMDEILVHHHQSTLIWLLLRKRGRNPA